MDDYTVTAEFGVSAELAAARISAALGPCPHEHAVPVHTTGLDEDLVAWLCPACYTQLPADWKTP